MSIFIIPSRATPSPPIVTILGDSLMIPVCCSGVHVRLLTACGLKRTFETSVSSV
jgi:hypothetical protein